MRDESVKKNQEENAKIPTTERKWKNKTLKPTVYNWDSP